MNYPAKVVRRGVLLLALLFCLAPVAARAQGTGLTGQYYDNSDFTTLVTTRVDPNLNFNWGTGIPSGTALTSADSLSVLWTGQLEPEFSEPYLFYVTADDVARLWVNDQVVALRTFPQGTNEMVGQIRLVAGQKVNLRLEYSENTSSAFVKLEWASASRAREIIPTARLYPARVSKAGGSLLKEHWRGITNATIASLTSNTNYPNKPGGREFVTAFECLTTNWADNYGTRVTGFIVPPASGNYTFAVSGDDVVELYLSTNELAATKVRIASNTVATAFRQWDAQPAQQSAVIPLVQDRRYYVELLHKESTGDDHWSVGWKKPGDADFSVVPGSALVQAGLDRTQPAQAAIFDTIARDHPRLYATDESFARLRGRWQSPVSTPAKVWAESAIAQANNILPTAPVSQPLNVDTARVVMNNMYKLGLAWQLTGNTNYAERAWTELAAVAAFTNWFDGRTLLVTAETTHGFAIAYDWMYPYWTQPRRDTIRNAIINLGLNPGLTLYQNNFWALRANCSSGNWSAVCNSGLASGALAVGTESEALCEDILNRAMNSLRSNLKRFTTDQGALHEGFTYLEYAQQYAVRGLAGLEWTLGSDFGLSGTPAFSESGFAPIYTAGPSGLTFCASDDAQSAPRRGFLGPWSARRFNQPVHNAWNNVSTSGGSLDALWYFEDGLTPVAAGAQPDMAFHGEVGTAFKPQEYVALRGDWSSARTTFVAAKAGEILTSHGHYDAGTFALDALGKRWFHDLGKELYSISAARQDLYRYRGEGHNTFIVNPGLGADMLSVVNCPLVAYSARAGSSGAFAIYDVTAAHSGVTRAWRGFRLLNHRQEVLVQDEIQAASGKTVWWFAHYAHPATIAVLEPDLTAVTLTQGGERLWCKIVSGGGTLQIMDAAPLPTSPNPAAQTVNSNFKKLGIKLTSVTTSTLAVWFVPLAPGENLPTNPPAITPLNTWKLVIGNDAPTASDGVALSTNGQPVDVDLRAFAADDWNTPDQLTYAVTNAQGGTVTLLSNGYTARFTLTSGPPSFGFTATDASALTSGIGTISIGLSPVTTVWANLAGGNWSTAANWLGNAAPVSSPASAIKFFDAQALSAVTVTASNDFSGTNLLNSLTLGGTGSGTVNVNLTGGPLRLVKNGITEPVITLDAYGGTFNYNVTNALILDSDVTVNGAHSGTFQLLGNLSGPGGLTRSGSYGTLVLGGNNSYAGPTVLSGGTTQIGNGGATGSFGSNDVVNTAALVINRNNAYVISNAISGSGSLTQAGTGTTTLAGTGTTTLAGDNSFYGNVTVTAGTLKVIRSSSLGIGPKSFFMQGINRVLQLSGGVTLDDSIALAVSSNSGDGAGISSVDGTNEIRGPVSFTTGNPAMNLSSVAGVLTVSGKVTLTTTSRTLYLGGASTNANIVSGVIGETTNGVLSVIKQGAGNWTLSATNTYTGNTTVNAGKLILTGGVAGTVVVNGGAFRGNGNIASNLTVAAGGALEVNFTGPMPRTGFNQVTLGNAASTLTLAGGLNIAATVELPFNMPFVIISNPGSAAVSGTFSGKPQNATFAASGYNWQISYTGGNGNDVTLTALSATAAIPGAPVNLTATAVNDHQINLNWLDAATNEIGFAIERSVGSNTNYVALATVAADISAFADTNAPANSTCFYRVRAFASVAAWSAYSAEASAHTFAAPHIGYQAQITFTNYPRPEVLTNFPVLIALGTNISGFDYNTFLAPAGGDLRFWSLDQATALNFEVENWNPGGQSQVWVKVPHFTNGCSVLVTWGDPAAVEPVASRTNGATWSEGFLSVWHLNEIEDDHFDSSPNHTASRLVSVTEQGTASGVAGGCDNFDGSGDYVKLSDMGTNPAVTVECWVNLNGTPSGADIGLVSADLWMPGVAHFKTSNTRQLKVGVNGAGSISSSSNLLSVGDWFYAAYTVAGSATNALRLWGNGALLGSATGTSSNINSDLALGREYNARYLNARLDEVRVSLVARSSNWLWATWQNIASNSVFNSYGAATVVASNLPPSLAGISNRTGNVGISLSVTNTASDPDVPPQRLIFSLLNPPAGATVNPTNGIFVWRPTAASAGLAQPITVRVTDNGTPSLSATQAFNVLVNPVTKPSLTGAQFTNGGFQFSVGGDLGPDYAVQASTNLAGWNTLFTTNSPAMPFSWADAGVTNFPVRFYRVLLGP